jgi:hypothetical protein
MSSFCFRLKNHVWAAHTPALTELLLLALLLLLLLPVQGTNPLTQERLEDGIRVILSYQNRDGGMATYENTRSFHWLEVSLHTG